MLGDELCGSAVPGGNDAEHGRGSSERASAAAGTLPPDRAITGSAVLNMARQVGSAIGVAVVVVILGPAATRTVADFHHGWAAEAVACLVACLAVAVSRGSRTG